MIDENELSSAHNILSITKLKINITITIPHNNKPKWLLLKLAPISAEGTTFSKIFYPICCCHIWTSNFLFLIIASCDLFHILISFVSKSNPSMCNLAISLTAQTL